MNHLHHFDISVVLFYNSEKMIMQLYYYLHQKISILILNTDIYVVRMSDCKMLRNKKKYSMLNKSCNYNYNFFLPDNIWRIIM